MSHVAPIDDASVAAPPSAEPEDNTVVTFDVEPEDDIVVTFDVEPEDNIVVTFDVNLADLVSCHASDWLNRTLTPTRVVQIFSDALIEFGVEHVGLALDGEVLKTVEGAFPKRSFLFMFSASILPSKYASVHKRLAGLPSYIVCTSAELPDPNLMVWDR